MGHLRWLKLKDVVVVVAAAAAAAAAVFVVVAVGIHASPYAPLTHY